MKSPLTIWAGRGILAFAGAVGSALMAAAPATALPLISEAFYDAVGSDDGWSFVEIYAAAGQVLDGYVVEGVNGSNGQVGPSIDLLGAAGSDGLFVLADHLSDGSSFVADAEQLANFDFQNGPDSIVLRLGEVIVDALGYGSFAAGDVFAGEGSAATDPPAGSSLARHFANVDSDDNALDFGALAMPTPGSAPVVVPEPATALLLLCGLGGLAHIGRR